MWLEAILIKIVTGLKYFILRVMSLEYINVNLLTVGKFRCSIIYGAFVRNVAQSD